MTNLFLRIAYAGLFLVIMSYGLDAQNQNIAFRSKMTFSNRNLANIWGYAAGGHEYALVGSSKGLIIVDVTDPDAPQQIVEVPGPESIWREIKTYSHYAYVTTEGGGGLQIIDLNGLPGFILTYHHYTGDGAIAGQLSSIHALHVDTTKGFLYAYGGNLFNGGAVVLDLNADPYNPTYAGKYDAYGYIHDGWVDDDTLYAAHIGEGYFTIVDMSDKSSPVTLGLQYTTDQTPHNTWLSKDRHVLFTTDEVDDSWLSAYDVSDPTDIQFLDKIQTDPGSNSTVHNTLVLDNFAVTAWYSDGVSIVDVSQPDALVQVGNYDVAPDLSGEGFLGCWGVYPFLPSGNLVASVISVNNGNDGELWVLTPTYLHACYVAGQVTDADTGSPLGGASIKIEDGDAGSTATSGISGAYKIGQLTEGVFNVTAIKPGYFPATVPVTLNSAQTTELNIALMPLPTVTISGQVIDAISGLPVPGAKIVLMADNGLAFSGEADNNGQFNLPGVSVNYYDIIVGAWGYDYAVENNEHLTINQIYTFSLARGYRDDFALDYGWEVSGTCTTGIWERADPNVVTWDDIPLVLAPGNDVLIGDIGTMCFVTGNSSGFDADDVENGTSILRSPVMDLSGYSEPVLKGWMFFTTIPSSDPSSEKLKIFVENGTEEALVAQMSSLFNWQSIDKNVADFIPISSTMRIRIECFDNPDYTGLDSYEAAFDDFKIVEGAPTATNEPLSGVALSVRPNPFRGQAIVEYSTPAGGEYQIAVSDMLGKTVQTLTVDGSGGYVALGQDLRPGVYFARLEQNGRVGTTIKLIKTE